ncbi:hypothetical protein AVE30378_01049 [Achromobacter veterisilvae]|uniref:Uncharacterized protein n=1 Tax=Achromobacter veterisilvae TaxID=2069367 RepID=A0A446C8X3_9BURK|nr:hypothetical protein [Achromobacter veterisilvae]SSW64347.1 hypothetical protein AVE30378_01049 [Achromobacter veterisilvae]
MNKINDGGPAFPNVPEGAGSRWADWDTGMTLRDYFAAKALSGLAGRKFHKGDREDGYAEWAAAMAYEFADAMLAARGAQ